MPLMRLPKMSVPDRLRRPPPKLVALFTNLLGIGGVQEAGRLTAKALGEIGSSRGWCVELLSLNDPAGEHVLPYCGCEVKFFGFGRAKARFTFFAILKSIIQASRKFSSIVLAAHPHLAVPASCARRANPALRMIVMSHGIEVWSQLSPLRLHALQQASAVLAPSTYTARKIADVQSIPEPKIKRVPWPLSPSLLSLHRTRAELPLPQEFPCGKVILTVGRWDAAERYKGADLLIKAIAPLRATIPDVHLVAVGGGDDLPRLRRIAVEEQVSDRVHFLANLSEEALAACYANADVFALPSTGEGFGLVFLEAMAFAKPVVGASAGGTTDLIRDGVNGLLIPCSGAEVNVELLAQRLSGLLKDDALRRRLGECGAAMVRHEYQFGTFRKALQEVICQVASNCS